MQTKLTSCFKSLDNKSGRMSKRWKILFLLVLTLLLAAGGAWGVLPAGGSSLQYKAYDYARLVLPRTEVGEHVLGVLNR